MKKKLLKCFISLLLIFSEKSFSDSGSNFYFSGDFEFRKIKYASISERLNNKVNPQTSIYLGRRFNDYFSFEFGYSYFSKKNIQPIHKNDSFFTTIFPIDFLYLKKNTIQGFGGNIIFHYPVKDNNEIILLYGINRLKLNYKGELYWYPGNLGENFRFEFQSKKLIQKFGLGIQHKLNDNLKIRLLAAVQNTSKFKTICETSYPDRLKLKVRNNYTLGIGIVYSF